MPHFRHFRNPAGPEVHLEETKRDTALFHCTRGLTLNEGAHPQWDVQETLGSDQTERMEDRAWAAAMVIYTVYITLVHLMMIRCCSVVPRLARGCLFYSSVGHVLFALVFLCTSSFFMTVFNYVRLLDREAI